MTEDGLIYVVRKLGETLQALERANAAQAARIAELEAQIASEDIH